MIEGAPLRDHLAAVQERTGVMPERLASAPDLPEHCRSLWRDFLSLHNTRPVSGMGALSRIPWSELDAYQRVKGFTFAPWEIEAIQRADAAFVAQHVKARKKPSS